MISLAKPGKGGKVLVEIDGAACLIRARRCDGAVITTAGAAMSVALYSNAALLKNLEDTKLCHLAYTP